MSGQIEFGWLYPTEARTATAASAKEREAMSRSIAEAYKLEPGTRVPYRPDPKSCYLCAKSTHTYLGNTPLCPTCRRRIEYDAERSERKRNRL